MRADFDQSGVKLSPREHDFGVVHNITYCNQSLVDRFHRPYMSLL